MLQGCVSLTSDSDSRHSCLKEAVRSCAIKLSPKLRSIIVELIVNYYQVIAMIKVFVFV